MIKSHLLYQLSYVPVRERIIGTLSQTCQAFHVTKNRWSALKKVVTRGVEPPTSAFGGQRSIQLSYVTEHGVDDGT